MRKGRLQPGRMFLVDTDEGRIVEDDEIKAELAAEHPYDDWLHAGLLHLEDLPEREHIVHTHASVLRRQQTFGYTEEELRVLLTPMARTAAEPIGSMGTDSPDRGALRPAADAVRLLQPAVRPGHQPAARRDPRGARHLARARSSARRATSSRPAPASCRQVVLPFPVIDNDELAKILHVNADGDLPGFAPFKVSGLYPVAGGGDRRSSRGSRRSAPRSSAAIARGSRFVVLSRPGLGPDMAPIPSLLLTSAVHHHLTRTKQRSHVSLLVEAGDVREVHHVALLIGYGAAAVNPYLAMESAEDLARRGALGRRDAASRRSATSSRRSARACSR